jgi:hypothetical protein
VKSPTERREGRRAKLVSGSTSTSDRLDTADPPVLLAILIAARRTGDRLLQSVAARELRERHGITIRFGNEEGLRHGNRD